MTFQASGFLSDTLTAWTASTRQARGDWFSLADRVNALAMRTVYELQPASSSDKQLTGVLLFRRGVQSFQGAILLGERGMSADARTLVRSCAETAIALGGLATIDGFIDRLIEDHDRHRLTLANALLSDGDSLNALSPDQAEQLRAVAAEIKGRYAAPGPNSLKWDQVAHKANMRSLYDTVYRGISGDAAHPSIDALNRHLRADAAGTIEATTFRPEAGDVADTLSAGVSSCLFAIEAVARIFETTKLDDDLQACLAGWKHLVG